MGFVTIKQSIHHFIDDILHSSPASTMITEWRVEESTLVSIISSHFHSIGIYYVEPHLRDVLAHDVMFQLKHSKLIQTKVNKAADDEKQRRYRNNANQF